MSNSNNKITRLIRLTFGIFMVVVYLGMAYLLAVNFFDWPATTMWNVIRWAMAVILALYGAFRCYRQVTGMDYYRLKDNE